MAVNLNSNIDQSLQRLGVELPPEEKETVVSCIQNYSTREGCLGKIAGIVYRIWNAIKSIFGMSDWQVASDALAKKMFEKVVERDPDYNSNAGKWAIKQMSSEMLDYILYGVNEHKTLTDEAQQEDFASFCRKTEAIQANFQERLREERYESL